MVSNKRIISSCPICGSDKIHISGVTCSQCKTHLETEVPVVPFLKLPAELQEFVIVFLNKRGNIREVEKVLGISYPTVNKKLNQVNQILGKASEQTSRLEVLERLERGEITAQEAAELLRKK